MDRFGDNLADLLLPVGVSLILVWFFMSLHKRRKTKMGPNLTARAHMEKLREQAPMRADLEALKVEIEQLARRMSGMLDNKAARIEALLDEAEHAIAKLERLQASDAGRPSGPPESGPQDSGPLESGPPESGPQQSGPPGSEPTPSGPADPAAAGEAGRAPRPGDPCLVQPDRLAERVNALADQGMPPEAIAKELDEYIGKIELIMSLRRA